MKKLGLNKLKLCLLLIDILLIATTIILPSTWLFERLRFSLGPINISTSWGIRPVAVFAVLFILRIILTIVGRKAGSSTGGLITHPAIGPLLIGILGIFVTLYAWEKVLEHQGFSAESPPIVIVGEKSKPELKNRYFYNDPELLWRFRPGVMFNGRRVNDMGHLDRQVDPVKKKGVLRVISMGCSITGQGPPPYSGYLNEYLNKEEPGKWDAFNMGVHGYSTSQGLRLFQNRAAELKPDFVTIMYGWNDHWRSRSEDSRRMAKRTSKIYGLIYKALQKKRFFQYIVTKNIPDYKNVLSDKEYVLRVPPEEYRKNLNEFIEEVRKIGAIPILIAAPRRKTLSTVLVRNRQVESIEKGIELHDKYLEILYEVAQETHTALIDLPNLLSPEFIDENMSNDGIHFRANGLKRIAREIQKKIYELRAAQ